MARKSAREVVKILTKKGFLVKESTVTNGSHLRLVIECPKNKTSGTFFFSCTPSDVRAIKNLITKVKLRLTHGVCCHE